MYVGNQVWWCSAARFSSIYLRENISSYFNGYFTSGTKILLMAIQTNHVGISWRRRANFLSTTTLCCQAGRQTITVLCSQQWNLSRKGLWYILDRLQWGGRGCRSMHYANTILKYPCVFTSPLPGPKCVIKSTFAPPRETQFSVVCQPNSGGRSWQEWESLRWPLYASASSQEGGEEAR